MFTAAVYKVKQNQNNQRALRINLMTILDFLISRCKNWRLSRCYFGSWRHAIVALAVE